MCQISVKSSVSWIWLYSRKAKGQVIPANVLLEIWVYVHQMRQNDAVLLSKFNTRYLSDLKRDPWTPQSTDDCMNSYSFSQHDLMRRLALFLAERDNEICFRRLYMPQSNLNSPPEWQTDGDLSSRAQIVFIHTGAMIDTQWPGMEFLKRKLWFYISLK